MSILRAVSLPVRPCALPSSARARRAPAGRRAQVVNNSALNVLARRSTAAVAAALLLGTNLPPAFAIPQVITSSPASPPSPPLTCRHMLLGVTLTPQPWVPRRRQRVQQNCVMAMTTQVRSLCPGAICSFTLYWAGDVRAVEGGEGVGRCVRSGRDLTKEYYTKGASTLSGTPRTRTSFTDTTSCRNAAPLTHSQAHRAGFVWVVADVGRWAVEQDLSNSPTFPTRT